MITITDNATKQIRTILEKENKEDYHLRLGITGGGCSGFQYFLGLDNQHYEHDESYDFNGLNVIIDKFSMMYMKGSTLDYSTDEKNPGFVFNNPNPLPSCNCDTDCCDSAGKDGCG